MVDDVQLARQLLDRELVQREQLRQGRQLQLTQGTTLYNALIDHDLVKESAVVEVVADLLSLPWVDMRARTPDFEAVKLLPVEVARRNKAIPLEVRDDAEGTQLLLAMVDPLDIMAMDEVSTEVNLSIQPVLVGPRDLEEALERVYTPNRDYSPPPLGEHAKKGAGWDAFFDEAQSRDIPDDESSAISKEMRDRASADVFDLIEDEIEPELDGIGDPISLLDEPSSKHRDSGPIDKLDGWDLDSKFGPGQEQEPRDFAKFGEIYVHGDSEEIAELEAQRSEEEEGEDSEILLDDEILLEDEVPSREMSFDSMLASIDEPPSADEAFSGTLLASPVKSMIDFVGGSESEAKNLEDVLSLADAQDEEQPSVELDELAVRDADEASSRAKARKMLDALKKKSDEPPALELEPEVEPEPELELDFSEGAEEEEPPRTQVAAGPSMFMRASDLLVDDEPEAPAPAPDEDDSKDGEEPAELVLEAEHAQLASPVAALQARFSDSQPAPDRGEDEDEEEDLFAAALDLSPAPEPIAPEPIESKPPIAPKKEEPAPAGTLGKLKLKRIAVPRKKGNSLGAIVEKQSFLKRHEDPLETREMPFEEASPGKILSEDDFIAGFQSALDEGSFAIAEDSGRPSDDDIKEMIDQEPPTRELSIDDMFSLPSTSGIDESTNAAIEEQKKVLDDHFSTDSEGFEAGTPPDEVKQSPPNPFQRSSQETTHNPTLTREHIQRMRSSLRSKEEATSEFSSNVLANLMASGGLPSHLTDHQLLRAAIMLLIGHGIIDKDELLALAETINEED